MNPITALPPAARAAVYYFMFVAGIALGAVQIAYGDTLNWPHWLEVASKVLPFVSAGFGITAASNTNLAPPAEVAVSVPEGGELVESKIDDDE